jgi:hypothetical protein
MNLNYLLPRLARHFLPERLTRFLLQRGWIIRPGLETREPERAVERYVNVLAAHGVSLAGKRVMVFGYGGRFALGVELLRRGATHVVLCDRYTPPNPRRNRELLPAAETYLLERQGQVLPRPEFITLNQDDIRAAAERRLFPAVDLVLSASVFEMLTLSERAWRGWLNPTSNLNRFRLGDYRGVFEKIFPQVEITILERDEAAFAHTRRRVRPEFVSGDEKTDSVTQIQILACR